MKYTKQHIRNLLENNDKAVHKAIVVLYSRQTAAEQTSMSTREHNGVGFNATDAELLSSFAEQIKKGRSLSVKQMEWARKKIMKYSGQLANIANERMN